jgi:formylglycine-generating enzyme required for sulfatase activity
MLRWTRSLAVVACVFLVPVLPLLGCSFDFYFDKPTNDLSSKQANFYGDAPAGKAEKGPFLERPTKVGSYAPNKLGLYDMDGNVFQWCDDWYDEGRSKVIRGGTWNCFGKYCSAGHANGMYPAHSNGLFGLRVARVPSGAKQ